MIQSTFIAALALGELEELAGELAPHNPFRANQALNLTAALISLLEAAGAKPPDRAVLQPQVAIATAA